MFSFPLDNTMLLGAEPYTVHVHCFIIFMLLLVEIDLAASA